MVYTRMGIFNKKHLCCLDHLLFLVYGELNEKTACVDGEGWFACGRPGSTTVAGVYNTETI